jgi:hypothetical protein
MLSNKQIKIAQPNTETDFIYNYQHLGRNIMISQKESVYLAVCEVIGVDSFNGKAELTKEQTKNVVEIVTAAIADGGVEFSVGAKAKYQTTDLIRSYTRGMVNNWLRKDTRLNGGGKYVAKNPGSRAGAGDKQLAELKKLRTLVATDPDKLTQVDAAIEARKSALALEKAPKVEINADLIPDELKGLLS